MAISNLVGVQFNVLGDGTSSTFTLDFRTDPYFIAPGTTNVTIKLATGVVFNDSRIASASLSGQILTINLTNPVTGPVGFGVFLVF